MDRRRGCRYRRARAPPAGVRGPGPAIGYQTRHLDSQIKLPAGMERRTNANFADGHSIVAAAADGALVIFLTDEVGAVLDDVTLSGLADAAVVPDCDRPDRSGPDGARCAPVLGVVRPSACPSADIGAKPVHAYEFATGKLKAVSTSGATPVATPVTCDCFMVRDEPIP